MDVGDHREPTSWAMKISRERPMVTDKNEKRNMVSVRMCDKKW